MSLSRFLTFPVLLWFVALTGGQAISSPASTSVGSNLASSKQAEAQAPSSAGSQTGSQTDSQADTLCPEPALSRVVRHRVAAGETLTSLSQRYNLIPATLMGMNPVLQDGNAPAGSEILVPPYNGIRVEVPAGSTWQDLAELYGTRADVLFEVNGCQSDPRVVFVPGVNWSPNQTATGTPASVDGVLRQYPLPATASISTSYGWQLNSNTGNVAFHGGVDLTADRGTPVLAAGEGTVAFASNQGNYGNLVVINHSQGVQTRYAQLDSIEVEVGETVGVGDRIGTVGATGIATGPHLHFEVRTNSDLGWVAQDPGDYFQDLRFAEQ
ncbi:MAG: M23 family metallopeptidase [Leptolyngbyaceae cyanobacterium SM1_4_3]|nr:M23 family metallopeptidase [Leptolyngbyaceae cyanobacterium SM1_4_3]NJO66383.1 M23 family metallopeptidase [Leptolyngbyaceae cyanobacterium RM1_405_57]